MNRRSVVILLILAIVCAAGFMLRLVVSSTGGIVGDLAIGPDRQAQIHEVRMISAVTAVVVGICLASSGVYLQGLLRNPLASPYILGLAAGAGLGIKVGQFLYPWLMNGEPMPEYGFTGQVAALIGCAVALIVVYGLSRRRGFIDPISLLLIGVMVSAVCGALIMLLQHLSTQRDTDDFVRWMMGSISQYTPWRTIIMCAAVATIGTGIGVVLARSFDVSALDDDEAMSLGVPLPRLRLIAFALAGLMTAAAVVLSGPIGFVGLIAPHLARLVVGPKHAGLFLGSALIGAMLLLYSDSLVQVLPQTHGPLPIGILTAALGGPIFIYLLRGERRIGA